MPAYTVSQLEETLGSYVEDKALTFYQMMGQVLPRMYRMGMWPDLCYEVSLSGKYGYVNIPLETSGVLACTVNNRPRPARSLWHDVRISGRSSFLSSYYGLVDDGYYPVILDMEDVQGTSTPIFAAALHAYTVGTQNPILTDAVSGALAVNVLDVDGAISHLVATETGNFVLNPAGGGIVKIVSIQYQDVVTPFDIVDPAFPTKVIASIPTGSGILRYHRFRTPEQSQNCVVHLLVKRDAPSHIADDTVVYLGNIGAIKNAMLAVIEEDSGDLAKAKAYWSEVQLVLDEELQAVMGVAKPTLKLDFGPCPPIHNIM